MRRETETRMFQSSAFGKATENDISALEERLGVAFPESYREFILRQNGGSPDPSLLVNESGQSLNVGLFLPVTHDLIEKYVDHFMNCEEAGLVPIALSGGGDYYLLDIDSGAIYYWDHECDDGRLDRRELARVAESVDQLVDSLVEG